MCCGNTEWTYNVGVDASVQVLALALWKDEILLQPREPGDEAMLAHVSTVSAQTITADQTQCTCRQINMSTQ